MGRGCGCSCLGCLGAVALVALLLIGSSYWFFVVQASAAVTAPATLILFNQPVTVNSSPASAGEALKAGDVVATKPTGHAAIQFPDGSYMRMAPDTTLQINSVQLQRSGQLQTADMLQKVGRTLVNVQHLASGASFKVNGHSMNAEVRGTEFELLVKPDNSNRLWVFVGVVSVNGKTSTTVTAGQEIDIDANGNLATKHSSTFDAQDPFPMNEQCSAAGGGGNAGTMQSSAGDTLTPGQSAEQDYYSPGGNLTVALCYPGSLMSVTVTDPSGKSYSRQGSPPVRLTIPNGAPGLYRAVVRALSVPPAGEAYSVVFATDAACGGGDLDTGTEVRKILSNSQIQKSLADAGATGVTLQVQGTSPTSARLYYYSNFGGTPISWTIVFYAASPNLGAVLTQVTVRGVNVTPQILKYLGSVGTVSISALPQDFTVDRVYSCAAAGDDIMVIEGHR